MTNPAHHDMVMIINIDQPAGWSPSAVATSDVLRQLIQWQVSAVWRPGRRLRRTGRGSRLRSA
ncbi:hypothetical protein [Micromonospora sp. NPDC049679]|uniref:hypothetical protein n=1 Tax=Micromonospora sp. NPDC049679 TaxID=3155920 RepID=UPI0033DC3728